MTVEAKIQTLLVANAALVALVPASRIRAPGNWQGLTRPYIVHFPVTSDSILTHSGTAGLKRWLYYQVSVVAETYASARAAADAVVTALNGTRDSVTGLIAVIGAPIPLPFDTDLNIQEIAVNFQIAGHLT